MGAVFAMSGLSEPAHASEWDPDRERPAFFASHKVLRVACNPSLSRTCSFACAFPGVQENRQLCILQPISAGLAIVMEWNTCCRCM